MSAAGYSRAALVRAAHDTHSRQADAYRAALAEHGPEHPRTIGARARLVDTERAMRRQRVAVVGWDADRIAAAYGGAQ